MNLDERLLIKPSCRHCAEPIDARAKVCPKCRLHQSIFVGLALLYGPLIVILISIFTLFFTAKKTIDAQAAADRAGKAESEVRNIAAQVEHTSIVIAAMQDDRPSFDRLRKIASDPSDPFSIQAKTEVERIIAHYSMDYISVDSPQWARNVNLGAITFDEAMAKFTNAIGGDKLNWISWIGPRDDADNRGFTKPRRLRFVLNIILYDNSLQNVHYSEYLFELLTGVQKPKDMPPFTYDFYRKWAEENTDVMLREK
jgi:hypothetical protein